MAHGSMHKKEITFISGVCSNCCQSQYIVWLIERQEEDLFLMNNERLVLVSNKQAAKETEILGLLCAIVLICLMNNIFFRARHI